MQVERSTLNALVENKLPDGSRVLLDPQNQSVFALNATAGAAWDACQSPATLSVITSEMQRSLGTAVAEDVAEEAVRSLQDQNLVIVRGASPAATSRRQFITRLGAAAVPLVVAMTVTEQRAFASQAQSFLGPQEKCTHLPCDGWPDDPLPGGNPPQGHNPHPGGDPFGFNPPNPLFTWQQDPKGSQH